MDEREIGVEEARKVLGTLSDAAAFEGRITYLTRRGRRHSAIVPLSRIKESSMLAVETRTAAREAITALAQKLVPAIRNTPFRTGVPAWKAGVSGSDTGRQRRLDAAVLKPQIDRIQAALEGIAAILDQMDAVRPNEAQMARIEALEGSVSSDDARVLSFMSGDRHRILEQHLDSAAVGFLRYSGLTVNGWENLLKPADETGATKHLADALLEFATATDQSAMWALESAQRGLAALGS